jgi:hypothetical protein
LVNAQADALGDTKPRFKAQGGSMSTVNSEVVSEIYKAMEKLGAGSDLLGIVGAWGDSLPESHVLSMLQGWNERQVYQALLRREAATDYAFRSPV